jgi:tetratricopeptide (TPR) repeat protein
VAALILSGCNLSFSSLEYHRGQRAFAAQDYADAIKHYRRAMSPDPESEIALDSAREAAQAALFKTRDFSSAIEFYSHLVKFSRDEKERHEAQRSVADIYFDKLNDYPKAIEEYNKLLIVRTSNDELAEDHFKIARAQFNLSQFQESHREIESALKLTDNREREFEFKVFLANIDFNTRNLDGAIHTYEDLIKNYPEKARAENITMNLVVCYEEQDSFDKAIAALQAVRTGYKDTEFIDLKIKRLRERKANLPGSKGLRK